jgi:hypothetical protein
MRGPRIRLRTLMIGIAFLALILTVIMQAVLLQRAAVREELYRAEAEMNRARAEAETRILLETARAATEINLRAKAETRRLLETARALTETTLPTGAAPDPKPNEGRK